MKTVTKRILLSSPAILAATVFIWYYGAGIQSSAKARQRHERYGQFVEAIRPLVNSDPRFQNIGFPEYTGGGRGALIGLVGSTNDLEALRKIYFETLSDHPAMVGFN